MIRRRRRHGRSLALLALALACNEAERPPSDRDRAWGANKRAQAVKNRADQPLPAAQLPDDADLRRRIFGMSFEEVAARMGPVRYRGVARFRVQRNGNDLEVVEKTLIESGPGRDVRVVQRDEDDRLLREAIRVGGDWYVRQEAGRLQTTDFAQRSLLRVHEEAFRALAATTSLFDPATAWRATGEGPDLRFAVRPTPSAAPFDAEGYPELQLESASGGVTVSRGTAVVVGAELDFVARFVEGGGRLEVHVERRVEPIEPATLDVADASEPPARAPVDLRPLDFLDELTKTSTIIGGDAP
jgi:hypothetical protein